VAFTLPYRKKARLPNSTATLTRRVARADLSRQRER